MVESVHHLCPGAQASEGAAVSGRARPASLYNPRLSPALPNFSLFSCVALRCCINLRPCAPSASTPHTPPALDPSLYWFSLSTCSRNTSTVCTRTHALSQTSLIQKTQNETHRGPPTDQTSPPHTHIVQIHKCTHILTVAPCKRENKPTLMCVFLGSRVTGVLPLSPALLTSLFIFFFYFYKFTFAAT